jgi:hypothetical protein
METLLTIEQIKNILRQQDIYTKYVCSDGTMCSMFQYRVNPDLISEQKITQGSPKRTWWIFFDEISNKFILRCSYFDVDDNPITYQQFYEQLSTKLNYESLIKIPAIAYTSDAVIEWVSTGENEWTAIYQKSTPTSGCMIVGALSKILLKPVEYVCGGAVPGGIVGFVYGKYADNNGGFYYTKLSANPQSPCCSELQLENCGQSYPQLGVCAQPGCCIDNISVC